MTPAALSYASRSGQTVRARRFLGRTFLRSKQIDDTMPCKIMT
jgi:hypothetical protein